MTCSDAGDQVLDQFDVASPGGEHFRVLNMRRQPAPGKAATRFVAVLQREGGSGRWTAVPLATVWFHRHFRSASAWPPEEALGAQWRDGMLCLDYESPWDPYAKVPLWPNKLDAHALWRARFDQSRRKWLLQRIRLYEEDERARR